MKSSPVVLISLVLILLVAANAPAQQDKSFTQWLADYQAYDVLQRELADETQTPERILKRAGIYLENDEPGEALALLMDQSPFADEKAERERLWMIGDSRRRLGHPEEAVFAFSRAMAGAGLEVVVKTLGPREDLDALFKDSWRVWYTGYAAASTPEARLSRKALLQRVLEQARTAWPETAFWIRVEPAVSGITNATDAASLPVEASRLAVLETDRTAIAKGLAALCLGRWELADEHFASLSAPSLVSFWRALALYVHTARPPQDVLAYREQGLVKAAAFWEDYYRQLPLLAATDAWLLQDPASPSWPAFKAALLDQNPDSALKAISRELESRLITPSTRDALRRMAVAFALLAQDHARARELFAAGGDPVAYPLPLRLAEIVLYDASPADRTGGEDPQQEYLLLSTLAAAAGLDVRPEVRADFWISLPADKLMPAVIARPLDRVLLLAWWRSSWAQNPQPFLARRIGHLFGETALGAQALLYLAQQSGQAGAFSLSAAYLERVDVTRLSPDSRADYLQAKASLQIELGREEEALATYVELFKLDKTRLSPIKRLKLALLAQQKGRLQWAQEVLEELWKDKEALSPAEQAEVLFWMAEGNGAMGRMQEALAQYLRVAWQYQEQNIWAVTAMYRAGVIYERQERFEAARKLLKTVIANAARDSQKEAAKARIEAIDNMLKQRGTDAGSAWRYPF